MTAENNELLSYIESSLGSLFEKEQALREDENSGVFVYKHKSSEKRLVLRRSTIRNDEVYRVLRGKQNEHLPAVYEVCTDGENMLVLEEYIEGKTLLECLNCNRLDRKTARNYARQLCLALAFLHKNGIIHRDIKPSNIIIKPDGTVVLIDLGIARMMSAMQDKDTEALGTAGYAAPEQFGLSQSGKATDIYALGVLLNIMLNGLHPTIETVKGRLGRIINKATSMQMSKRYQSAEQMYKALKR